MDPALEQLSEKIGIAKNISITGIFKHKLLK